MNIYLPNMRRGTLYYHNLLNCFDSTLHGIDRDCLSLFLIHESELIVLINEPLFTRLVRKIIFLQSLYEYHL